MKEAMGGISLFQIVIAFILLFTGIMCLTINKSKAYGVKDEIINVIESSSLATYNSGNILSEKTSESIAELLREAGYRVTGKCPDDEWVGYDRTGRVTSTNDATFCVKASLVNDTFKKDLENKCSNNKCRITTDDFPTMVYYDIVLFYQLDIPALNDIMNFRLQGSTKVIYDGNIENI